MRIMISSFVVASFSPIDSQANCVLLRGFGFEKSASRESIHEPIASQRPMLEEALNNRKCRALSKLRKLCPKRASFAHLWLRFARAIQTNKSQLPSYEETKKLADKRQANAAAALKSMTNWFCICYCKFQAELKTHTKQAKLKQKEKNCAVCNCADRSTVKSLNSI